MNVDLSVPLIPDAFLPVSLDDGRLDTPAILVALDIVEGNIVRMAGYTQAQRGGPAPARQDPQEPHHGQTSDCRRRCGRLCRQGQ
jgi:hypothetical protein